MGKITVYQGKYNDTCTTSADLTAIQQKKPAIRDIMEYADARQLCTLIVSGAKNPYDLQIGKPNDVVRTKIGTIPKDKLIGDIAYRYNVMGKIQAASIINGTSTIGTPGVDGTFVLSMRDNLLYPGMVARFHTGLAALVKTMSGSNMNYVYTFQTTDGTVFNWATHVAPQQGDKTCFGGHTAYGENSLRSYSRTFSPDQFINHLTIQRKTASISGSALTDVLWYEYMGGNGAGFKGWMFKTLRDAALAMDMENEYHKWYSKSTMKDSFGNLLQRSLLQDERGFDVVIGDGVEEQIDGANDLFASGADGLPTLQDVQDLMSIAEDNTNTVYGSLWYVITGKYGYAHMQNLLRDYHVNQMGGRQVTDISGNPTHKIGGEDIPVGGNFDTFNFAGNQIILCKDPMRDRKDIFTQYLSNGTLAKSSEMIFLNQNGTNGQPNMEILSKGAYGINRSQVVATINGLSGYNSQVLTSVDGLEYNLLKEDGIFIYRTAACGKIKTIGV